MYLALLYSQRMTIWIDDLALGNPVLRKTVSREQSWVGLTLSAIHQDIGVLVSIDCVVNLRRRLMGRHGWNGKHYLRLFHSRVTMGSEKVVAYFYDEELGNYSYGDANPMRPHRLRLTHNLVESYGLTRSLLVHRPKARDVTDMTEFHADGKAMTRNNEGVGNLSEPVHCGVWELYALIEMKIGQMRACF